MSKTTVDHYRQAVEFLNHWYSDWSSSTIKNLTKRVLTMMDVGKAERILGFSQEQYGNAQSILGVKDRIMLWFTKWTPEIVHPGLRFWKDWIIDWDGNTILPFIWPISWLIDEFKHSIVNPEEVVKKSQDVYPTRLREYYREMKPAHYDYLSRPTMRQCFEFASRQSLDMKSSRYMLGRGRRNWPYFIHFLEALFPEYISELFEYGSYYVIFTDNEIFLEKPSKQILRIPANPEYREIFKFPRTAEVWNKLPPIDQLIASINKAVEDLVHIDPVPIEPTDLVIYPNKKVTQGIWFTENHDCPHIFDEEVVKILTKILWFFGSSVERFFPTRIRSLPGDPWARIQILSTKEHFLWSDRFRKPLQDFEYFEKEYLPWKDSWDFPFINTLIEEIYSKKWELWNDKKLVYNILAGIYRHLLVDISEDSWEKIQKWQALSDSWKKIVKWHESFHKSISHLDASWLYKKWSSEKMIWLWLFLHFGYLVYISYAEVRWTNSMDAEWARSVEQQIVPPAIRDYFFELLQIKPTHTL